MKQINTVLNMLSREGDILKTVILPTKKYKKLNIEFIYVFNYKAQTWKSRDPAPSLKKKKKI